MCFQTEGHRLASPSDAGILGLRPVLSVLPAFWHTSFVDFCGSLYKL